MEVKLAEIIIIIANTCLVLTLALLIVIHFILMTSI